ncbi:MAG: L-glutamate gamma-semialdehyde dehydrogenase [Candidatus Solibacter usitatus]|nr:L-glutamate gamma-semialdehyde dehydrogenase [Candidatus Solibacter usitatus]
MRLSDFRNEPYADFSKPENAAPMRAALAQVRAGFGKDYELRIGGERFRTGDLLKSINPSNPDEVVGLHHKATAELAERAIAVADAFFPAWAAAPAAERIAALRRAAAILRRRKLEFDAWLVYEAGKSWAEAEADVSEAIDFCDYYALLAERQAVPEALVQLPGERDEMRYLPLGVGVVIPPWNFPLAILVGMTTAALVTGNTVVVKPSSDTPTIAAKFAEVLEEAGFPAQSYTMMVGSGAEVGDLIVTHPRTRFISFTGSREVGLRINELAARTAKGQIWIKRVIAEMGGKDAIIIDEDADLDAAVQGVLWSAFGYQGQKCSACSRAIVSEKLYDAFLEKLAAKVQEIQVGPADDPANYMGPVINEKSMKSILDYIAIGRAEGRVVAGGNRLQGNGYFLEPTVIADILPESRIFQEEIFGPVLAVTRAKDFEQALAMANNSEYGLTGAIYSNNPAKVERARNEFFVGNLYINRKCTGAMVGAHPFGGFNMSGTDSKAGGPDYLLWFTQAKSIAERIS